MDNQRLVSGTRFGDLHPDTIGAQPEQKERENVEELQFKVPVQTRLIVGSFARLIVHTHSPRVVGSCLKILEAWGGC